MQTIRDIGKKIKDKLIKTETLEAKYIRPGEDIIPQTLSLPQASSLDNMPSTQSIVGLRKQQVYVFRTSKGEKTFPTIYFSSQPTAEENYVVEETSFLGFSVFETIKKV